MRLGEWPSLLPLVQGVLNHSPSRTLAGMSPITLFTGLPAHDPFRCIIDKDSGDIRVVRMNPSDLIRMHEELASALLSMHKKVETVKGNIRRNRRLLKNSATGVQIHNFEQGDFVLVGTSKPKDKLEARWKGPFKITRVINNSVFEVEDLLTGSSKEVHYVRLRPYNEADLNAQIKEHIQYHNQSFEVKEILEERDNRGTKELLVKWRGFEEKEATWEPLETIIEDVPQMYDLFKETQRALRN
jgi:hypothetical protein